MVQRNGKNKKEQKEAITNETERGGSGVFYKEKERDREREMEGWRDGGMDGWMDGRRKRRGLRKGRMKEERKGENGEYGPPKKGPNCEQRRRDRESD